MATGSSSKTCVSDTPGETRRTAGHGDTSHCSASCSLQLNRAGGAKMPATERILEKQAPTSGSQSLALKTELFGSKLL